MIDPFNNLWIGTNEGLAGFDGSNWQTFNVLNSGLPNNIVVCMSIDVDGNKWIGTYNGLAVFNENGIVSIDEKEIFQETIPSGYHLSQNYPNPFNPSTTIEFDLPKTSEVTLKIYNILGEEVTTLLSTSLLSGSYKYEWDASGLASGVYLYRLEAADFVRTRKMILMK
jgi:hypothetical protein